MPGARAKGGRVFRMARAWAEEFPSVVVLPMYQVSRFAQPQPFDMLVLRKDYQPLLVEVRSNQWRTGKASTVNLARLPGFGVHKQIWMHSDGKKGFKIREFINDDWVVKEQPWEVE